MAEDRKSLDILVIDDEEGIRDLLSTLLQRKGYGVTLASSGNQGIREYQASVERGFPPGLIFTDLVMPDGTGVDVTRDIKSKNKNTVIYGVTGFEANQDYARLQTELRELAPDGVLQKPVSLPLILGIAERVALGQDHRQFVADFLVKEAQRYQS